MDKVNGESRKENSKTNTSIITNKESNELSDEDLENISGGVPGYWDYNDVTTHQ